MYIQIENLRGMTPGITRMCKRYEIHSIGDLARIKDKDLLRIGKRSGVDLSMLKKLASHSRQILRMDQLVLERLIEGHLVFVDAPQDSDSYFPDWPFRVVEEAQAPYGNAEKIAEISPVKV